MAKVALVNPGKVTSTFSAELKDISTVPIRRSLAQLSSCLKEKGHNVVLFDLRMLREWEDYMDLIKHENPDFLGVTALTCEHDAAVKCCEIAKEVNKKIVTVVGGIQPTMFPEEFLKTGFVDYVLKGEGEISFPELVEDTSKFPPVFWGETPDLDSIPFEDRTLWPDYEKRIQFSWWGLPTPLIDMLAQRGCPYKCKFCCGPGEQNLYTVPHENGLRVFKFKARSVRNVMEELVQLYDKYHFKSIVFSDDHFLINPKWVDEFCQAMKDYGFVKRGIKWWAAARVDAICRFEWCIEEMKEAGLEMISIGFESFSDRMLEWMNKKVTSEENWEAVRICRRLKLKIFGNFMFGMPYSDGKWYPEDDIITFEAIKKIKPRICSLSYFKPIPGSQFYDWCVENELIMDSSFTALREGSGVIKGVDYEFLEQMEKRIVPPFRRCLRAVIESLPESTRDRIYQLRRNLYQESAFFSKIIPPP